MFCSETQTSKLQTKPQVYIIFSFSFFPICLFGFLSAITVAKDSSFLFVPLAISFLYSIEQEGLSFKAMEPGILPHCGCKLNKS